MIENAVGILLLFGITIALGYIGSLIFRKTKIPDIVWLMLFGLVVSSFGLMDRALFLSASPLLAALALLIILFDAGLNMDFYQMIHGFSRSFILAILGFVFSMVATALMSMWLLQFDLLHGLLLGAILGGTSSAIVITIAGMLHDGYKTKTLVSLESIITDPLCIAVAIALINVIVPSTNTYSPIHGILSSFSIGAVLGLIVGVIWLRLLDKLQGKPFDYMLTLAVVFLLYAGAEFSGGSGAIAALLFGLVLGNGKTFSKILKMSKEYNVNPLLKTFQSEISFFIRSFFFVYLGLIVVISPQYILYGLAIAAALIVARLIAVRVSTIGMHLSRNEKNIMTGMAPRGLAAAVLAQLPITYGIPGAEVFSSIIFVVIFATVIYTSIAVKLFYKEGYEKEKPAKTSKKMEKEVKKLAEEESEFRALNKTKRRKKRR